MAQAYEAIAATGPLPSESKGARYLNRLQSLKSARSSYDSHWRELADYQLPRQARFSPMSDRSRAGTRRGEKIFRDDAGDALETGIKGLMMGATPPTRPWFGLATPDKELMEFQPVKIWLEKAQERLEWIYHKSNTYNSFYMLHENNFAFATGLMLIEDHPLQVLRTYVPPIGSYYLAAGPGLEIDTLYREVVYTVEQLVRRFGKEQCSLSVQSMFNSRTYDALVPVVHAVQPRLERDYRKMDKLNMPYTSCYIEAGGGDGDRILGESGFRAFPAVVARWGVTGEDVYGSTCPGMRALPDIKGLQIMERVKLNLMAKAGTPPLVVPAEFKNKPGAINLLTGGISYVDNAGTRPAVYQAHEVYWEAIKIISEIQETQVVPRLNRHYMADIFRMISRMDQAGEPVTAAEIYARLEEKAQQLGPMLHRLENETLSPFVEMSIERAFLTGQFPPAPTELQGQELRIEFKSILHEAQGAGSATGIVEVGQFALQFAEVKPEVLDKFDLDQAIDELARTRGVPAEVVRPDDAVAAIRAARAEEQQAMQAEAQASAANKMAGAAKQLSETQVNGESALDQMAGGMMQ